MRNVIYFLIAVLISAAVFSMFADSQERTAKDLYRILVPVSSSRIMLEPARNVADQRGGRQ